MGVGQSVIYREGFFGRALGLWKTILRGAAIESREQLPRLGEAGISQCIIRILRDRLIEVVDRSPQIVRSAFVPKKSALEVELVSFGIRGRLFRYRGFLRAS